MPTKKNKKKIEIKVKKIFKKQPKKTVVKKKKRTKKNKIQLPDKIEDLAKQLPEDKYTEALTQKEELEKVRPAIVPIKKGRERKKKEYRGSKTFMWFLVIGVFFIILVLWLLSLQFTLSRNAAETNNWASFKDNFTNSFDNFKTEMQNFKNSIQKMETAANINSNGNTNKNNVNALTDEQIKKMEEKVFPKLKNNLNN